MTSADQEHNDDPLRKLLATERRRPWWRRAGLRLLSIVVVIAILVLALWQFGQREVPVQYRTVEAGRGDLTVIVTATGTIQPLNQVEVGSELSGTIEQVYVDYNDRVKRGQVMAELDTVRLEAQVFQARAALASAEARIEETRATVVETEARFRRCEQLALRQLCAQEELDTLRAAHTRAQAGEMSASAEVSVARATLDAIETDLAKAKIRSPIDGVVLKREIESGQTVAASLQTPVLFVLAEDLTRMRLHVFVDEADIGQVREGQSATFTVDAWPAMKFPATITQVRVAPQTVEGTNVVSYEAVLAVDNSDLRLLPGMTATADIVVLQVSDALIVPNAAFRFTPPAPDGQPAANGGMNMLSRLFFSPPRRASTQRVVRDLPGGRQTLWILQDGEPVSVEVQTGASDGRHTEVKDSAIGPGTPVVVGTVTVR